MKDWTDAFKEKMINDRRPLPEGELEMLERIISRRERGKRIRRMAYISSAALAAAYALIVFLPITTNTHEGNELVELEAAVGTKITLAETVEENNEPINPSTIKKFADEVSLDGADHLLSRGQLQRLGIVRAVLKDTPIIILDEPTAGLDAENELCVLNLLKKFSLRKTIIIATHRQAVINFADGTVKFS